MSPRIEDRLDGLQGHVNEVIPKPAGAKEKAKHKKKSKEYLLVSALSGTISSDV